MKIDYRKCGDYFIPNLVISNNTNNLKLGKYGRMRLNYLKTQKKAEYTILLMEEKLKPFIEVYSDDFYESIEDIRKYLNKHNKNYKNIKDKIHKIMDRNLNIQKLLDETYLEDGLNADECKDLSQVIVLYNNLQDILEKEIYFKGSMDSYYYFKRIGVIN